MHQTEALPLTKLPWRQKWCDMKATNTAQQQHKGHDNSCHLQAVMLMLAANIKSPQCLVCHFDSDPLVKLVIYTN